MLSTIWKYLFPERHPKRLSESEKIITPKKSKLYGTVKLTINNEFNIDELFYENTSEIENLIIIFVDQIDEDLESKIIILASLLPKVETVMAYIQKEDTYDLVENHKNVLNKFLRAFKRPINLNLTTAPLDFLELDENILIDQLVLPNPLNNNFSLPVEIENVTDENRLKKIQEHKKPKFVPLDQVNFSENDFYYCNVHPKRTIKINCKAKINKILLHSYGKSTAKLYSYIKYHVTIRHDVDISEVIDDFYVFN